MDRRLFILSAAAVTGLHVFPLHAQGDDSGGEWGLFRRLAAAFDRLLRATNPIANDINRRRFVRFLRQVQTSLSEMRGNKETVRGYLRRARCERPGDVPPEAIAAARNIGPRLGRLATDIRTFGRAIRPSGTGDEVARIADGLARVGPEKMWMRRIPRFCALQPGERAALITEINRSLAIIRHCSWRLNALIDKFS